MSKLVVYEGPTDKADISTEFHIEDEDGDFFRLYLDQPVPVSDSLSKELLGDSERCEGHQFRAANREETEAMAEVLDQEPEVEPPAPVSPVGPSTGGGTTAAESR